MKDDNSAPAAAVRPALNQRISPPASSAGTGSTPLRLMRRNAKAKSGESAKPESFCLISSGQDGGGALLSSPPSSVVKGRAKSTVVGERKVRRSLGMKSVEEGDESVKFGIGGSENGRRLLRPVVVEQFAPPTRRRTTTDGNGAAEVNLRRMHELEEKLDVSENVIKDLRMEVVNLRDELDDARALNAQLQLLNKGLFADLDAAKARIAALTESSRVQVRKESSQESKNTTVNDNRKIVASGVMNVCPSDEVKTGLVVDNGSKMAEEKEKAATASPMAPPPPPLPSRYPVRRSASASTQRAPAILELYRSLSKPEARKDSNTGNGSKGVNTNVHNSIVGEIQNRSTHLMAIKMDIETKGDFINSLISKVLSASYTDIEDVLQFVDWLDKELSSLADECSVLKHFPWPEKKADAMREAAIEYRELKLLENEISSYEIDAKVSCEFALKKLAALLDKSERSIQRLVRLRSSVMVSYRDFNIPTEWMLDSGIISKIKHVSMKLANLYMKRVTMELHAMRSSDREYAQEALLLQGVHFAYKVHQFAGGLDSETLRTFEELRKTIPGHLIGSRELQSGSILS